LALAHLSHLSWLECARLLLILVAASIVLYRRAYFLGLSSSANNTASVLLAVTCAFIVTQFDPATSSMQSARQTDSLHFYSVATAFLWVISGGLSIASYRSELTWKSLLTIDRVVLGTLLGVLSLSWGARMLVAGPASTFGVGESLKLVTYLMIWISVTRSFSDASWCSNKNGVTRSRWLAPISALMILMAAGTCYGAYRAVVVVSSLDRGQAYFQEKDYEAARGHYERAQEYNATAQMTWARDRYLSDLAVIYFELGDPKSGESLVNQLAGQTPDRIEGLVKVGDVYGRSRMWDKASTSYKDALRVSDDDQRVVDLLGTAYLRLRDSRALFDLAESQGRVPKFETDNYDEIALLANLQLHRKAFGEALDLFRKMATIRSNDWYAEYKIGLVFQSQGQLRPALTQFQLSVDLKPDFAEGYFRMGKTHEAMNDTGTALSMYQRCLELLPNHLEGRRSLSRISQPGDQE
jgi:tetratricopeptide (TPR) repeat protein